MANTGYLGADGAYYIYSGSNYLSSGGAYTIEPPTSAVYSVSVIESMGLSDSAAGDLGDESSDTEAMGLSDSTDATFIAGSIAGMIIFVAG